MNYEEELKAIQKENEKYLEFFYLSLKSEGLVDKTIRKHMNNVGFYINEFLPYYEPRQMKAGCYAIDEFLGDWFIRKAMWSTSATIKENCASLKKFYKVMLEHNFINEEDYAELINTIKFGKESWLNAVEAYNNFEMDW